MIPKKIHYIWFGNNPKSELVEKCIASWRKYLPDYEIIEWNEQNYDPGDCEYFQEAYKAKKWAFASDYARFDILHQHGGIYLDTDVEFLKPLPEELLEHGAFTGFESNGNLNPGLIFATVPGFPLNKELVNTYRRMHFVSGSKDMFKTVNVVIREVLEKHGALEAGKYQVINGLALYPSMFFCGYDLDVAEYDIQPETISVHHYAGTWTTPGIKKQVQKMLKKILGVPGYRKFLTLKRALFGISGAKTGKNN